MVYRKKQDPLDSVRLAEMLGLPLATSPEAECMRKGYKLTSRKIHPDKCDASNATEAFKFLSVLARKVLP